MSPGSRASRWASAAARSSAWADRLKSTGVPRVQSVEAGNQPLRVVGRRSGNRVAGLGQRVGQAHLGSVDGERAVARDLSVESQLDIAFRDPPSNSAPRGVDLG